MHTIVLSCKYYCTYMRGGWRFWIWLSTAKERSNQLEEKCRKKKESVDEGQVGNLVVVMDDTSNNEEEDKENDYIDNGTTW